MPRTACERPIGSRPEARALASVLVFLLMSCAPVLSSDRLEERRFPHSTDSRSGPDFASSPEEPSDTFPMSVLKTETLIYEYLAGKNFEILRRGERNGGVRIRGEKNSEVWEIELRGKSPSKTEAGFSYTRGVSAVKGEVESLRNHIARSAGRLVVEEEDSAPYIPSAVLSRIESAVCLESVFGEKKTQFSGFVVDQDGLILATAHDLKGHQELNVTFFDGRRAPGRVVRADHHWDLALIRVDLRSASHIPLENGRNLLGVGERVYTVGCPVKLRGTIFSGIVNGPPRRVEDRVYWQVSMKIHPGSSGSPVFDSRGALAAVVKGRFRGTDSLGFLIPFETIVEFVKGIDIQ